jgi:hypothetical protein
MVNVQSTNSVIGNECLIIVLDSQFTVNFVD